MSVSASRQEVTPGAGCLSVHPDRKSLQEQVVCPCIQTGSHSRSRMSVSASRQEVTPGAGCLSVHPDRKSLQERDVLSVYPDRKSLQERDVCLCIQTGSHSRSRMSVCASRQKVQVRDVYPYIRQRGLSVQFFTHTCMQASLHLHAGVHQSAVWL